LDFNWFPGTAPEQCSQRLAVQGEPPLEDDRRSASQFIIETVRRHPGQVTLLTIGAMTNVAAALCADPGIVSLIPEIASVACGCPPAHKGLDWNAAYDLTAVEVLARSGANWLLVGGDVSNGNNLGQPEFDALAASGLPSAGVLLDLVFLMKKHKRGGNPDLASIKGVASASTCDVMALAAMLIPEQMDIRRGRASVDRQVGCIDWQADPAGPHRITHRRLAPASYRPEILRRMLTAPKAV
jgi:inosine-uridine nucleoside N-ribohydrolase